PLDGCCGIVFKGTELDLVHETDDVPEDRFADIDALEVHLERYRRYVHLDSIVVPLGRIDIGIEVVPGVSVVGELPLREGQSLCRDARSQSYPELLAMRCSGRDWN